MRLDVETVTRLIAEIAAEEVLPRFRRLAEGEVREKAAGELVTVADEAAERRLEARLKDLWPGSVVLGEEAAARDVAVMDYLAGEAPVWVVDPVDGTGNFARGREPFAVMVALVRGGETLAAWIHDPVTGRTARAELGGGALLDGMRLRVAVAPLSAASMSGTLHSGQFGSREINRRLEKRRQRVHALKSLRCAGAEYVRLAAGQQHFSFFTKLAPWDHAPGALLFTEAGGVARLLDGRAYTPLRRDSDGLLLAPDDASWQTLYDCLFGEA